MSVFIPVLDYSITGRIQWKPDDESICMSILSDLDPKNARFDDDTGHTGAGKMSWTAPLGLFAVAGLGLAVAVYHGGNEQAANAKTVVSPAAAVVTPQVGPLPAPIPPAAELKPVMVEPASATSKVADSKPQAVPPQRTQKAVAASKPSKQQAKKEQTAKMKLASSKDAKKKPQQQSKTVKTAGNGDSRKPAKRDVEIITAIVK